MTVTERRSACHSPESLFGGIEFYVYEHYYLAWGPQEHDTDRQKLESHFSPPLLFDRVNSLFRLFIILGPVFTLSTNTISLPKIVSLHCSYEVFQC